MATRRKTTTERGLGWSHQQETARLLKAHIDGTPCWWCGRPMYRDRTRNWDHDPTRDYRGNGTLAGDHSIPRAAGLGTKADRLLHGACNSERQEGARDHLRPTATGAAPTTRTTRRPGLLMPWPTLPPTNSQGGYGA